MSPYSKGPSCQSIAIETWRVQSVAAATGPERWLHVLDRLAVLPRPRQSRRGHHDEPATQEESWSQPALAERGWAAGPSPSSSSLKLSSEEEKTATVLEFRGA